MPRRLTIHPGSLCPAVASIEVDAARPRPGLLALDFGIIGAVSDLYLPPEAAPARADELWRRTCFESFVRLAKGEAYIEINLSPSRAWAAYRFSGHRTAMRIAGEITQPLIETWRSHDRFELRALVDLGALPELPTDAAWRLGLTAVIEEAAGRKSYWALAHPLGRPDFHHPDTFALDLAP